MEDESEKMIQDSATRLGKAYGELRDLVVREEAIPFRQRDGLLSLRLLPAGVGEEGAGFG